MTVRPKAYLAGPDVFHPDARRHAEELVRRCAALGIDGIFPLDPDGLGKEEEGGGDDGPDVARGIYVDNLDMIDRCDLVIANMEPFRGPSMDVGTAFEMGYAARAGIPVFGYSGTAAQAYDERVSKTIAADGLAVDQAGMSVEDFGLTDNLMVALTPQSIHETFDAAAGAAKEWWYSGSDARPSA